MLEFIAIGPSPDQGWRRPLPNGLRIRLGRAPIKGWAVPWDLRISREHVDLTLIGDRLEVRCLATARNPIYHQGEPLSEFCISAGEDFRIGGTTFRLDKLPTTLLAPHDRADAPSLSAQGESAAQQEVDKLKAQLADLRAQVAALAGRQAKVDEPPEDPSTMIERRPSPQELNSREVNPSPPQPPSSRDVQSRRTWNVERSFVVDVSKQSTHVPGSGAAHNPDEQPRGEHKSSLFVLKAQIEAQAAKMRGDRPHDLRAAEEASRDSDIEALKQLLEDRTAKKAGVQNDRPVKTDSSQRISHIAALLALHEARAAGKAESADPDVSPEPRIAEQGPDETLPHRRRIWSRLPDDVRQVVREIAAGRAVTADDKQLLAAAINQLIASRSFLLDAELQAALESTSQRSPAADQRGRWSEAEIRQAARHALSRILPDLLPPTDRASTPTSPTPPAERRLPGECVAVDEVLRGSPYAATYVAGAMADNADDAEPVELVRIDALALWRLYEASPAFRAAVRRLRGGRES